MLRRNFFRINFLFDSSTFEIRKLVGLRFMDGEFQVNISWVRFEAFTWEPAENTFQDVPDLFRSDV